MTEAKPHKPSRHPSPMSRVADKFKSKAELAKILAGRLDPRTGESPEEFAQRLSTQSNSALLRLYDVAEKVQKEYGGKEALVMAILKNRGHATKGVDLPYKAKLMSYSLPRLYDMRHTKGPKLA